MNVNCIICADLFMQSSETYTTKCGHIFHYQCLIQWLERSKSCPQCRQKTSEKNITRIYFNFANLEGVSTDVATLQNKIDSLDLNLRLKENERREIETNFQNVCGENEKLVGQLTTEKENVAKLRAHIVCLKDYLAISKIKAEKADKIEEELKETKAKLKHLDHLQKALNGTYEDAERVASQCENNTTLRDIMLSLKKEVEILLKKKEKMHAAMRKAENEASVQRKLAEQLRLENEALNQQLREHEKCVRERHRMKRKIEELEGDKTDRDYKSRKLGIDKGNISIDGSKSRNDLFNDSLLIIDSPDVATRVKQIKDSDSPYMQVKTNSMGMILQREGLTSRTGLASTSTSIFKSKRDEALEKPKPVPGHYAYDGMGGYERNIDMPPPVRSNLTKRPKTSSTTTSSKFKKLARPQNNKIDVFLNISGLD